MRLSSLNPYCAAADSNMSASYSFCGRIRQDYVECLQACEAQTMKTYLEWRVKNWRVKKESTIKSYWKRLSCAYIDYAGRRMDNGTELDIRDVRQI